ncbi:MAG: carboxymuconolactone decarboxylase family protein, partial [Pelagimonas sp.]|nr:carboxymuconolactone decarboxylase family protein [Pelagimonas sp.]
QAPGKAIGPRLARRIGLDCPSAGRPGHTREEFCEALAMATYMGGGPSYAYSAKALKAFDTFSQ